VNLTGMGFNKRQMRKRLTQVSVLELLDMEIKSSAWIIRQL